MNTPILPDEVLDAFNRGQSCVPMNHNKVALVKWKEFQERRPSLRELHDWLIQFGDRIGGWARITGAMAGVIVLDDDKHGWIRQFGLMPHVRTGSGGEHWVTRHPGWRVKTVNSKASKRHWEVFPDLDVKGDGGYSLICGFNLKGGYTWLRSPEPDPLELLPREVREFFGLLEPPKPAPPAVQPASVPPVSRGGDRPPADLLLSRYLDQARLSGRNNAGFLLLLQFRDNGYSESEARAVGACFVSRVAPTNTKGDFENYTLDDYEASLQQVYRHAPRQAWRRRAVTLPPLRCPRSVPLRPLERRKGEILPPLPKRASIQPGGPGAGA